MPRNSPQSAPPRPARRARATPGVAARATPGVAARSGRRAPPALLARDSWKRLSPDERRAQLIAIAEELFQTRPYSEIGVVDVAKAAGITHGLIYHYFPSKEALFIAALAAGAQDLLERCTPDPALPLPEQVQTGVRGYLDYVEAHEVAYLNLFRSEVAGHADFFRICDDTRQAIADRFITGLGLEQASLPATRLALRGYLGFAETLVLEWLRRRSAPRDAIERLILAVIGTALRTAFTIDAGGAVAPEVLEMFDAYDRYFAAR